VLAIIDSGSACLSLSDYVYDYVVERLLNPLSYKDFDSTWGYLFYCSEVDLLETFDVLFGDVWLEVLVDDYVINFDGSTCGLCIRNSDDAEFASLGDVLMKNFYIVHDVDNT
jgi:hypothetical protein